jgi:glycosyltransferase involved in cell wall biosynthesis
MATKSGPLVSLCMSTYSRPDLFPESLDSLLKQTYEPLEILILADGSNKTTLDILKSCKDPRLRWISTPTPSGMFPATNRACKESKGKYLLFCADDDVLLNRAIDQQVELMQQNPNMAFCHADYICFDDYGKELNRWISHRGTFVEKGIKAWPRYLARTCCCITSTIVRRSMWDTVGGYDEDAGNPGDNSLYLKLLNIGDEGHVSRLACKYRVRTKKPDTWEKKYRNLIEYYKLAQKHLKSPHPMFRGSLKLVEMHMKTTLILRAVPLLISAPTRGEEGQLHQWLKNNIFPGSGPGRIVELFEHVGALYFIEKFNLFGFHSRIVVKRILARLRSVQPGQSK